MTQMYGLGIPALKIISLSFVFAGISMVLCAAFQALNKANTSLVITLARQLVILIPLTYGLMKCFGIHVGGMPLLLRNLYVPCIHYLNGEK